MSELDERNNWLPVAGRVWRCNAEMKFPCWNHPVPLFRELRTFHGGIDTAQSLPRCPCKMARLTFSSTSSVTPIQSIYESTRHVTWSASAGDEAPEDGKYLVSTLILVMDTADSCDRTRKGGMYKYGDSGPSESSRTRMRSSAAHEYTPFISHVWRFGGIVNPMAVCYHGYAVIHRTSQRPHSYGRSFSTCPIHWENPNFCRYFSWDDEPGAQAPVKQDQTTAPYSPCLTLEYMPYPASSNQLKNQRLMPTSVLCFPSAEKRHAMTSTEDIVRIPWKRSCTYSPSQEYERPSPPPSPLPNPTAPSEFTSAHPVKSDEVTQDLLDALPTIPIYVRELKRQISTLQESNEIMESRILQLEKQLRENEEQRVSLMASSTNDQ